MSRLRLVSRTLTLSGGTTGAEDWGSTEKLTGGLIRVFRINVNQDGITAVAPAMQVNDENGDSVTLDEDLYTTDPDTAGSSFQGILVESLTADFDDLAEDDVVVLTIEFESD